MSGTPGVWDAVPSAEVTAALCASAVSLWRQELPAEVAEPSGHLLAELAALAELGRRTPSVAQLQGIYGDEAQRATQTRSRRNDLVSRAMSTGAGLARAIDARGSGSDPELDHAIVAFAALDAVAGAPGVGSREVLRAHVICSAMARGLGEVFDRTGSFERERSRATVATIAAGVGVGLLRDGSDEVRLAHTVGLLASCSLATGPVPAAGDGRALVLAKAAGNAVLASLLVGRGLSTNRRALEAGRGLLRALTGQLPAPELDGVCRELAVRAPVGSATSAIESSDAVVRVAERIARDVPWSSVEVSGGSGDVTEAGR